MCIFIAHSWHVETVVLLSQLRQKPDDYIDVDIDVAELEGTSAETKATYEKIKKYVAEHNDGMKVSNLYIAQVKRKCGIELAEKFNLAKSEDARQPTVPEGEGRGNCGGTEGVSDDINILEQVYL